MLDVNALLSATEAAELAGVTVSAIGNWRTRGYLAKDADGNEVRVHLPVAKDERGREIRDSRGRPKYRLLDVVKAEAATKERARRPDSFPAAA